MSENEQKAGCVDADGNPCFPIDPGPLWSDLKGRLEKVAAGLQFNRETHVVWRDWLEKSPDNEKVNPHGGNAKFHADTVLEYDGHIGTVHDTISAIATLSPARSGEAVVEALHNAVALFGGRCTDATQQVWLEQARTALGVSPDGGLTEAGGKAMRALKANEAIIDAYEECALGVIAPRNESSGVSPGGGEIEQENHNG
jgi:hypothetical protein